MTTIRALIRVSAKQLLSLIITNVLCQPKYRPKWFGSTVLFGSYPALLLPVNRACFKPDP